MSDALSALSATLRRSGPKVYNVAVIQGLLVYHFVKRRSIGTPFLVLVIS